MKKRFIIVVIAIFVILMFSPFILMDQKSIQIKDGYYDLSHRGLKKDEVLFLDGQWQYIDDFLFIQAWIKN